MSLRFFHLLFILCAFVLTDMFGAWAVWRHGQQADPMLLVAGIVSFLLGFGIAGYAIYFVQKAQTPSSKSS